MQTPHVAHSGGDFKAALFWVCSLHAHGEWRLSEAVPVIEQQANNARWKVKKARVASKGQNRYDIKVWKEAPTKVPQMATFLR